jgi:hypothetical protein
MEPGHPFFTKYLDKQRARQRRLLALVPDSWMFEARKTFDSGSQVTEDQLGFPESVLREQADKEIEALGSGLADAFQNVASRNELRNFVVERKQPMSELAKWFGDILEQVEMSPPRVNEQQDEDVPLIRLICLLVWADRLAGDGYMDSRLKPAT